MNIYTVTFPLLNTFYRALGEQPPSIRWETLKYKRDTARGSRARRDWQQVRDDRIPLRTWPELRSADGTSSLQQPLSAGIYINIIQRSIRSDQYIFHVTKCFCENTDDNNFRSSRFEKIPFYDF